MRLKEKARDSKKIEIRENEYDKILANQNQDALMNTTRKFSSKRRQQLEAKINIPTGLRRKNERL